MKYLDLIKLAKEKIEDIKAPFVARKNELSLEAEINDIESKIADADLKIQTEKSSKEVNWKTVRKSIDDKALLERELQQMKELQSELF